MASEVSVEGARVRRSKRDCRDFVGIGSHGQSQLRFPKKLWRGLRFSIWGNARLSY